MSKLEQTTTSMLEQAISCHQEGRLDNAELLYKGILRADPANFDCLQALARLSAERGDFALAAELFDRALALQPDRVDALFGCGHAWLDRNEAGKALAYYERALELEPGNARAHNNLGNALRALRRVEDALRSYDKALAIAPDFAGAHSNRGNVLRELRRLAEAVQSYDRAIALQADFADAWNSRGVALRELGLEDEALASHDEAIRVDPDCAEAHYCRSLLLYHRGNQHEALAGCRRAIAIRPGWADARWAEAIMNIPVILAAGEDVSMSRRNFALALESLDTWYHETGCDGSNQVGSLTPFHLAYQEQNNRDLLTAHGVICSELMQRWLDRQSFTAPGGTSGGLKRIGIVSAHFRDHSVWNAIVKGWFRHLDRAKFELHGFSLGTQQDAETAWAKSRSASFTHGDRTLGEWVRAITEQRIDVLIYPEIGIDNMSLKLASLRLARVQAAAWGHPETTGLPTIDYYISAESFEPAGAASNYSEQLVALPNLGCSYGALAVAPAIRALPDFDPDIPLLLSPGTPFKYAPQHDWVIVEIARRLGKCRFIYFEFGSAWKLLKTRLETAFAQSGLRFEDYCAFVPWQERAQFLGLMQRAQVYLDTIGFSGFNTAMQAVGCGLPMVTYQGRFMRGRFASGILQRMGIAELIAPDTGSYVDLAVRLASDASYREHTRTRIESSRQVLFDDPAPIRSLESFLESV
jgi:protein O-GlcNAc transferase